jgi:hypothetical protein
MVDEPQDPPQDEPQATDGPAPETDEPSPADDPLAKVRHEAAGYRRRLRETEEERDRLTGTVQAMQRIEVERAVAEPGGLARGDDLWTAGVALEELLTDEGAIDPEKVAAARDRVLEQRPHWRQREPSWDGGVRGVPFPSTPDFAKTLRDAAGG